jgi:hypothetical protein
MSLKKEGDQLEMVLDRPARGRENPARSGVP